MNTPITDKLNMKFHEDGSASFVDSYVGMMNLARRFELDRAALMEFLSKLKTMADDEEFGSFDFRKTCRYDIPKVIAAARANFPDED